MEVYKTVNRGRVFPVNSLSLEKRCPHKKACSVLHSSEYSGLDVLAKKPPFLPVQFRLSVHTCRVCGKISEATLGTMRQWAVPGHTACFVY